MLLQWNKDKGMFLERLCSVKAPLKIGLKTKNEGILLEEWINYYGAMVGKENIFIFDHGSDSPVTLAIYEPLKEKIPIVQFGGFHNNVHNVSVMPELYAALRSASAFFGFFDTDERLVLFEGGRFLSGKAVVDCLLAGPGDHAYPATWLNNTMCSRSIFSVGTADLEWGLKWGKPILSSSPPVDGIIMHNAQIPLESYGENSTLEFFCLHLKNLFPSQRIAANLAKLLSRGVISKNVQVNELLASPLRDSEDPIVRMYIDEIRRMAVHTGVAAPVAEGQIAVLEDGCVMGFSDVESRRLNRYIQDDPAATIRRVLRERVVY